MREVCEDRDSPWLRVPRAQEMVVMSQMAGMRSEIEELARGEGDSEGMARRIAQAALSNNMTSAEHVSGILEAVKRQVRPATPTLAEVDALFGGVEAQAVAGQKKRKVSTGPTVEFAGRAIPVFSGSSSVQIEEKVGLTVDSSVPTVLRNAQNMLDRWMLNKPHKMPLIFMGDPSTGKTALPIEVAAEAKYPVLRLNGDDDTRAEELLGTWKTKKTEKGTVAYFEPGKLLEFIENGGVVVSDEGNALPTEVQQVLADIVTDYNEKEIVVEVKNKPVRLKPHKDFHLLFNGNIGTRGTKAYIERINAGCNHLYAYSIPGKELEEITSRIEPGVLREFHAVAADFFQRLVASRDQLKEPFEFNLRTQKRAMQRMAQFLYTSEDTPQMAMARAVKEVYIDAMWNASDRAEATKIFNFVFGGVSEHKSIKAPAFGKKYRLTVDKLARPVNPPGQEQEFYKIEFGPETFTVGDVTLPRDPENSVGSVAELEKMLLENHGIYLVQNKAFLESFYAWCKAKYMSQKTGESLFILGPGDCGKNIAARAGILCTGQPKYDFEVHESISRTKLMGGTTIDADGVTVPTEGAYSGLAKGVGGGNLFCRHWDQLPPEVSTRMLPLFEDAKKGRRSFLDQHGAMADVDPGFFFSGTATVGGGKRLDVNKALLNRHTLYAYPEQKPKDRVKARTELLKEIAKKISNSELMVDVAESIVAFESSYKKMLDDKVISSTTREHAPVPDFKRLVQWLEQVKIDSNETEGPGTMSMTEAFIKGAVANFDVPPITEQGPDGSYEHDKNLLLQLATGLGNANKSMVKSAIAGKLRGEFKTRMI